MEKHAYLIMAHDHFAQLGNMLSCLDNERVDIFLHIDKKSKLEERKLKEYVSKSKLYFTKRISVSWGGYSQIKAELILLEEATSVEHYVHYHLLTGLDFPLRKQTDILNFYDGQKDKNFISLGTIGTIDAVWFSDRLVYFYPFQEYFARRSLIGKFLRKSLCWIQKKVGVNRLRGSKELFSIGAAYFDITDKFARYIVSQKTKIEQLYINTFCADEIFIQWLWLNWQEQGVVYVNNKIKAHPYINRQYLNVMRAIDWTRGAPYTFTREDYDMLMNSGCLFARKLDDTIDGEIIKKIVRTILDE